MLVVVELAKLSEIQAAVLCHPSLVTVNDIKVVKSPISILAAEIDQISPPELVKQFEEVLSGKPEVDSFVKIFPGVAHGWTVRYELDEAAAVTVAGEAHQDMLAWFTKHINSTCGEGTVENLGGLKTYITGSPLSHRAAILISDIFGYEAPNLRKLADKVAAAGFYVVVPDFFYGNHFLYGDPENLVPVWMKSHGTDKGYEDAKAIIEDLKSKGTYAIGAAGFCWGEVKSPISILAAELDKYCPLELVKQFEDILSGKPEVDSFVKIFPGAGHGWTVRYNLDDEAAVNLAEESHQDMLAWFTKHVK
ncbi:hypothetical protein AAC387_Pa09g0465 [Persea americana]